MWAECEHTWGLSGLTSAQFQLQLFVERTVLAATDVDVFEMVHQNHLEKVLLQAVSPLQHALWSVIVEQSCWYLPAGL